MNNWTTEDAASLRQFLSQPGGRKFIRALEDSLPEITAKNFEQVALQSKEKTGAEKVLKLIRTLSEWNETKSPINQFVDTSK